MKDRLALAIIEAAEKDGSLKPGQTVVEATSGNTGIAVAMMCAQRGYPCVITMAEPFSVERRKLMRMLGAKVIVTPKAGKGTGMVRMYRLWWYILFVHDEMMCMNDMFAIQMYAVCTYLVC